MTQTPDWRAGYAFGRTGEPYVVPEGIDAGDFADGYVVGKAEWECNRANIKVQRNMGAGIRRMLRILGRSR